MSAGWDKVVKVWNLTNCKLKTNHYGHHGYLNTVTVSPDGSLCASGGKDGLAMLWDLNDGKHLYTLDSGDAISALCFSPNRYWLCAATGPSIKIWVSIICLLLNSSIYFAIIIPRISIKDIQKQFFLFLRRTNYL